MSPVLGSRIVDALELLWDATVMNEQKGDNDAKTGFTVKPEEGLELLKIFLTIQDAKLRADVISTVKQMARAQPNR